MLIKDVCNETGLTKKAIEYYQQKGLISPEVAENGYRYFSQEDIERLKKIALLRKFSLSIEEISRTLSSQSENSVLSEIKYQKEMEYNNNKRRLDLLEELIQGEDIEIIEDSLNRLMGQSTIKEKLLNAFPGYYGRFASIYFGNFLNGKLETKEQKEAYQVVVTFLDGAESFNIPADLKHRIDTYASTFDNVDVCKMSNALKDAAYDFETYYSQYKETIEQYIEYKKTQEYKESDGTHFMELFREFGKTSGYYDTFIPAMRRLSPEYNNYYEKSLEASEKLMAKHPEIKDWYK